MAKWSEKMRAAGITVDTWNTCPHCNCKNGHLHDKFCPTQLRLREGNPAAQPWGSVSNQWAGHMGCEYCNAKDGEPHQPSCVVVLGQYLGGKGMHVSTCPDCGEGTCEHAAPDETPDEDTCPNCGDSICDCWLEDVDEGTLGLRGVHVKAGYHELFDVLREALEQAQVGKGEERHGNGLSFLEQPALTITRAVGRGFPLGQAMKKIQESQRMDPDAAKRELLGAINYLAAAILSFDE